MRYVVCLLLCFRVAALTPQRDGQPKAPQFAVISVRPTVSVGSCGYSTDGIRCESITLEKLVEWAFALRSRREIEGIPVWGYSSLYSIDAKVDPGDVAKLQSMKMVDRASMIKQILYERFNLRTHWITKKIPEYALEVGKARMRMQIASADDLNRHQVFEGGARIGAGGIYIAPDGTAVGQAVTLASIVDVLSLYSDRKITDRTGLSGLYDFRVRFPRPPSSTMEAGVTQPAGSGGASGDVLNGGSYRPTLFTAVADLGLRLKSVRVEEQILAIDQVGPPSEN